MFGIYEASSFFALPLELREDIYRRVFSFPNQGPDILRTCREIYTEAHKFLYQKPLTFKSQKSFYTWSDEAPHNLLAYVSDISLHIRDVDLKPILSFGNSTFPHQTPRLLTSELYQADVDKFRQTLAKLPKVKTVTIRTPRGRPSFLYRDFIAQILGGMNTSCPELLNLRLEGNYRHHDLQFLATLSKLESFSFNGFSSSSPAATADILASLQSLRSLNMFSDHACFTSGNRPHCEYMGQRLSFTGEVVRTIKQLASISVDERSTIPSPTLNFMPDVLVSLHAHRTLTSLTVRLSHLPDVAILASLEVFLEQTSIKDLQLDWPDLCALTLQQHRLLSGSLQVFWVRVACETDALDIMQLIADCRDAGDLEKLEKVVLIRNIHLYNKMRDHTSIQKESFIEEASLGPYNVRTSPIPADLVKQAFLGSD
jgi:hypothetical protein